MTDADPWPGKPFDDDVPWADPNIRKDYEAALGRFILLFNELDYYVGSFVRAELDRRGQSQLYDKGASFSQRLSLLGVLTSADTHLPQVSVARLQSLNGDRNLLAHGHFEQNPFDGSYKVFFRQKYKDYPIARIERLADQMTDALEQFRLAEAVRDFEPVTVQMTCAAVRETVSRIPRGQAATYTQVAAHIEGPKQGGGLRCGRLIRDAKDLEDWPWHRVVKSDGTISSKNPRKDEQRHRLEDDGVQFVSKWRARCPIRK